jgi:hypothetical protein
MVRDITKEEQEAIKRASWNDGYAKAIEISKGANQTRENESFRQGVATGRNEILREMEGVQWSKRGRIVLSRSIIGSVIGCGIILALAVCLTNLPK